MTFAEEKCWDGLAFGTRECSVVDLFLFFKMSSYLLPLPLQKTVCADF